VSPVDTSLPPAPIAAKLKTGSAVGFQAPEILQAVRTLCAHLLL